MINFFFSSKNILKLKLNRLGKYVLPVCFIMLAILYAGTKPQMGRYPTRANAKDAKSAEDIVSSGQLSLVSRQLSAGSCQCLDGMPVVVEKRLIELDNLEVEVGEPCIIMMSYDYKGRRISKQVYVKGEWDNYPLERVHSYVYDDWNLVLETIKYDNNQTQEIQYFWGNDLSGTLNGAGGVGGLIAVSIDGYYYIPTCDNNGNIISYVNEQGQIVASYKYDAFGNTLEQAGIMSNIFKHRFSTKYYDEELPVYYYGYRFYSPVLGRWLNRDPIEEDGGLNLYAFCTNNSINGVDVNGCVSIKELILGNIGYDFSRKIFSGYGIPIGTSGAFFQMYVSASAELFDCCKKGKKEIYTRVNIGIEPYVVWGKGKSRDVCGRDRNKRDPWRLGKMKKFPDYPPDSGFRTRKFHTGLSFSQEKCPKEGLDKTWLSGAIFLRGSAGIGFGVQFKIQKSFDLNTRLEEGWSVSGDLASHIWGATIEIGGGIYGAVTYGPIFK